MKMCQKHWDALRQGVHERGMGHLIPGSGQDAVDRIKKEQQGEAVPPDPLMEAHNMILSRSIELLGMYILTMKEGTEASNEGHYCPLCEAREHLPAHPETGLLCDESWIVTLLDYLKQEYEKEGWFNVN